MKCEAQLITAQHDIAQQLDRCDTSKVNAILLDFAKAFGNIPHNV